METIWKIFRAWMIANFAVFIFAISLSMCIAMGGWVTNVIVGFFGTEALAVRIPLTVLFAIVFGYIALSLVLGNEGYFDEDNDLNVHRGARLGKADELRGRLNTGDRLRRPESVIDASRKFDMGSGFQHVGELLLALFTPSNWILPILRCFDRNTRKSIRTKDKIR